MTNEPKTSITISKETYDTISNLSANPVDHRDTEFHPDGTVSVAIPNSALDFLKSVHPDLDTAIRTTAHLWKIHGSSLDSREVTFNGDGTVSIPVSDEVLERLKRLHPDPAKAIRKLINLAGKPMNKPEGGMMVYSPETPDGQAVLATQKLTLKQLMVAVTKFQAAEKEPVATPIGINEHGFYYSNRPDWNPTQPNAFDESLGWVPWVYIQELLGNVPDGTTGDFMKTQGQTH